MLGRVAHGGPVTRARQVRWFPHHVQQLPPAAEYFQDINSSSSDRLKHGNSDRLAPSERQKRVRRRPLIRARQRTSLVSRIHRAAAGEKVKASINVAR
jgi:hypothetical protein